MTWVDATQTSARSIPGASVVIDSYGTENVTSGALLNDTTLESGQLLSLVTAAFVHSVGFYVGRTGTGGGGYIEAKLYETEDATPTTTVRTSTNTIASSDLSLSPLRSVKTFTFSPSLFVASGETFAVVLSRSTATSFSNAPVIGDDNDGTHPGTRIRKTNSGSFVTLLGDEDTIFTLLAFEALASPPWHEPDDASASAWGEVAGPSAIGNWNRFVGADPIRDEHGGIDFGDAFTLQNPFAITEHAPISFTSRNRENPT